MPAYEIRIYQTAERKQPFTTWIAGFADQQARARIQARLDRIALGNFDDHKPLGGGVVELRIDWGPGYRVYLARVGRVVLLLLCGGDKTTQQTDIANAQAYLEDYKARTAERTDARPRSRHGRHRGKRSL